MADDSYTPSDAVMGAFRQIESGGNPNAQTGSYKGLYQLSDSEYDRYGGAPGKIFDPDENTRIARLKIADEASQLSRALGRPVTDAEVYLAHQQGVGGATAHLTNPDQPAWQSMAQTGEGRQKGPDWAKRAIWGNIPDQAKAQFGDVSNVTSGQFTNLWAQRFGRAIGQPQPTQTAQVNSSSPPSAPLALPSAPPTFAGAPQAPQAAPQADAAPNYFAQIPATQFQSLPIQYAQRRPINLAPLRAQLGAPTYAKG